jgi:hypothetical protein
VKSASRILIALLLALTVGVGAAACGKTPQELGIPIYKPSDTVSEASGSTVLKTSDSVDQVSKFYGDWIEKDNWDTVSHTSSSASANFTIKKSGDGATIAISTSGSDTLISISTYPSP